MRPALKAALSRLTDRDRTDILGALLQGDLGGSEEWADAIWPVEAAFIAAFPVIENSHQSKELAA